MEISVTFGQQIAELKAELALRQNVYRKWVINGRMKREQADKKYAAMRAALHVLIKIQEGDNRKCSDFPSDCAKLLEVTIP